MKATIKQTLLKWLVKYDTEVFSGAKTYLTIAVLIASFWLIPEDALDGWVKILTNGACMANLFAIVEAKRQRMKDDNGL